MKKAAKWLLCINLLAWTLQAVQVLTVNMEQKSRTEYGSCSKWRRAGKRRGRRCSEKEGSTDF